METLTPQKEQTTEVATKETFSQLKLREFEEEIKPSDLIALSTKYKDLKVDGIGDRTGLKAVEEARKELKS